MNTKIITLALAITLITIITVQSQPAAELPIDKPSPTPDNFNRAECDRVFGGLIKDAGLGKFVHYRELMAIDIAVVRPNPRHVLFPLDIRSRCRASNHHAARCGQALHVDAGD
jgi:hypothetical protein